MMKSGVEHVVAGEQLVLLADRAIYWPGQKTLLLSDPHFGKASSFRQAGVPVPRGTTSADLDRLSSLITTTGAERLTILGDFFHHHTGQSDQTMGLLAEWRAAHSGLVIDIVQGNHDRHSLPPPTGWNMQVYHTPQEVGPFLLCHEPCRREGLYVISGHIHPAVRLADSTGHGLSVPCFYFAADYAVMPAFGGFTGTARVKPTRGDQVFVIAEGEVIALPASAMVS